MKLLLVVLSLLLISAFTIAQVPQLVSHQGYLADSTGAGIDGTLPMTFKLFADSTGGSAVLTQTFPSVDIAKGVFNVNLDVSSATFTSGYWLETQVNGEVLTPRTRLTSAPYSLGPWTQRSGNLYYNAGKIGIGTSTPSTWGKLHIGHGNLNFDSNFDYGIMWVDSSILRAHIFRWATDNRLYVTNNGTSNLTGMILAVGGTSWLSSSDKRLKENITETGYGLGTVMQIPVKEYNFKGQTDKKIGIIAQELYPIIPELVSRGDDGPLTDKSSPWAIDYAGLTPVLVKAMQEQQQQIEALMQRVAELEARLGKAGQ
jgi:hypothetical protein